MQIAAWFGKIDLETGSIIMEEDRERMILALLDGSNSASPPIYPTPIPLTPIPLTPIPPTPIPPIQPDLRGLALSSGFVADDLEYNSRLREVALELVRRQLAHLVTAEEDLFQAVGATDDISEAINLLDERLYEWHRLHNQRIVHGRDLAESLQEDPNMGPLARSSLGLRESRSCIERMVSSSAEDLAPNLSSLAGPVLAARLISKAGGLRRLAGMPSSRLQVMGAEKSLFKHLNGQASSPKHGIIFRHPAVMGAPRRLRGKIARTLAGKLALAARLDYYGGELSPDLAASLESRLKDIKRRGAARGDGFGRGTSKNKSVREER